MSWIDKILRKRGKDVRFAPSLSGYTPIFSQYPADIYADETVRQAIQCIVREMKKLNPCHIRLVDQEPIPVDSSIQYVLNHPNPLMTTSDFIEKTIWLLMLNYNAFIVPIYHIDRKTGNKVYDALYPVKPVEVDFIEQSGKLFVHFRFANNYETYLDYADIIHIRHNYSMNDYMGGNEIGEPDNRSLLDTIALNDTLLKGIAKAMNASYQVNGVVKYNTLLDSDTVTKNLRELEEKLRNSEPGFLPLDLKSEFIPIDRKPEIVGEETLAFVDTKILRHFGVPLCILNGDFTKSQFSAFHTTTLEPLIVALSQAFTKVLITKPDEQVDFLQGSMAFMEMSEILKMVELLSPTGALSENEKRHLFGLPPVEGLDKRYISLNWIDANKANIYQVGEDDQSNQNGGTEDGQQQS